MSRSALWRQEANVKERERIAIDNFKAAVEEGRNCYVKGQIPLFGSDNTFNLNPMLLHNISKSPYFLKCCTKVKDWGSLVDEIYYEVKNMEPWTLGATKVPSTAFCLLVRLFTLRCTEKQMVTMLNHPDSPYIRCVGFLYLRYGSDPRYLYSWFEPYLYDKERVRIAANPCIPEISVGEYAKKLLTEMDYYGTLLPRLPVSTEREIKVRLLQEEKKESRAEKHFKNKRFMDYCQQIGSRVRALYGDNDNPTTWYDAVVDRVIKRDDESGEPLLHPKFVVTFPEYGNTEIVSLGEIDEQEAYSDNGFRHFSRGKKHEHRTTGKLNYESNGPHPDSKCNDSRYYKNNDASYRHGRGYDRCYTTRQSESQVGEKAGSGFSSEDVTSSKNKAPDLNEVDLMQEVLRREREKSLSSGKAYAHRPLTFKSSLAVKQDGVNGKVSKIQGYETERIRKRNFPRRENEQSNEPSSNLSEGKQKLMTTEERRAVEAKKQRLLHKYG